MEKKVLGRKAAWKIQHTDRAHENRIVFAKEFFDQNLKYPSYISQIKSFAPVGYIIALALAFQRSIFEKTTSIETNKKVCALPTFKYT